MREFVGKAAFVTGGASALGWRWAGLLPKRACKVMLADIEKTALDAALTSLSAPGQKYGRCLRCCRSRFPSTPLPKQLFAFAKSILCNNAGVGARGASIISRSITGAGFWMST